jgi:hypothetical protein
MSEQGWRDFLAAENVGDWVVLHGGATAVFPVLSLGDAARLADAVARVPGIDDAGVLITIADDQLTVRLTRGIWQLEPRHSSLHERSRPSRDSREPPRIAPVHTVPPALVPRPPSRGEQRPDGGAGHVRPAPGDPRIRGAGGAALARGHPAPRASRGRSYRRPASSARRPRRTGRYRRRREAGLHGYSPWVMSELMISVA